MNNCSESDVKSRAQPLPECQAAASCEGKPSVPPPLCSESSDSQLSSRSDVPLSQSALSSGSDHHNALTNALY